MCVNILREDIDLLASVWVWVNKKNIKKLSMQTVINSRECKLLSKKRKVILISYGKYSIN